MGDTASIGEIAARAGVAPSTIRYYERLGVLPKPPRIKGRRRYSADVLRALLLIRVGQAAGLTLAEMRALAGGEGAGPGDGEWEALLRRKLAGVRARIEQLRAAERMLSDALACGCLDLAECAVASSAVPAACSEPPFCTMTDRSAVNSRIAPGASDSAASTKKRSRTSNGTASACQVCAVSTRLAQNPACVPGADELHSRWEAVAC